MWDSIQDDGRVKHSRSKMAKMMAAFSASCATS
jgi:hypothetical protein